MKKKGITSKLILLVVLLSFLASLILPLFADNKKSLSLHEKQKLLDQLTAQKSDLAEKLKKARVKENNASIKLRTIKRSLSNAQRQVRLNSQYLESNQDTWLKTKRKLDILKEEKKKLEEKARKRIVSIYKKDQMRIIDSLVTSKSTTDYMDYLHYQEKILNYDRNLMEALEKQTEKIEVYSSKLYEESKKIISIRNKLKNIENSIQKQEQQQSTILSQLRKERANYELSERQLERESIKLIYKISKLSGDKSDNPDSTGTFTYPLKAPITSPFGPRRHPIFGVRSMHSGIDLAAPNRSPIKASEGGLVIYAGWYGGYGKVVIIDHAKGYTSLYAHLSSIKVKVGQRIKQSTIIGTEGTTGYATGPHLHFEIRQQGKPKNPVLFLTDKR